MAKKQSKAARWADAAADARQAFETLEEAWELLQDKLAALRDVKDEYQEWYDNMPESLQDSPTGEKLAELEYIELEPDLDMSEIIEAIEAAENADLPLGFGRD
jgi:ATP-dependent protease HslVU (ClpYQ) peptidase subunit